MKTIKYHSLTIAYAFVSCLLFLSSCKKDNQIIPHLNLDLATGFNLKYGNDTTIDLSNSINRQNGINLKLEFEDNTHLQITKSSSLKDKLKQAIKLDSEQKKIIIKSEFLYPNNAKSVVNKDVIPADYKIKVVAETANGVNIGEQILSFKVLPSNIIIKGIEPTVQQPFSYALFSNKETIFELVDINLNKQETSWFLPKIKDEKAKVSLVKNQIIFAGTDGNLSKLEEKSYDLEPNLLKDGFLIGSTKFKVIFIPEIKFFYGSYYSEYDISVKTNYLHVWLNSGFSSTPPALYPEKYKSKFSIIKIEKDNKNFEDTEKVFGIKEDTGVVFTKSNNKLDYGSYKLTIKAITTKGLEFTTTLTLVSEK